MSIGVISENDAIVELASIFKPFGACGIKTGFMSNHGGGRSRVLTIDFFSRSPVYCYLGDMERGRPYLASALGIAVDQAEGIHARVLELGEALFAINDAGSWRLEPLDATTVADSTIVVNDALCEQWELDRSEAGELVMDYCAELDELLGKRISKIRIERASGSTREGMLKWRMWLTFYRHDGSVAARINDSLLLVDSRSYLAGTMDPKFGVAAYRLSRWAQQLGVKTLDMVRIHHLHLNIEGVGRFYEIELAAP